MVEQGLTASPMAAVCVAGGRADNREGRMTQAVEWVAYVGAPLHDEDGNVVGTIEEFYVETGDHGCSVKR